MSEKLALEQCSRQRGAVDGDEGLFRMANPVDRRGGQLLAGAGFTENEYGVAAAVRHEFDHLDRFADGITASNHPERGRRIIDEPAVIARRCLRAGRTAIAIRGEVAEASVFLRTAQAAGHAEVLALLIGEGRPVITHRNAGARPARVLIGLLQELTDGLEPERGVENCHVRHYSLDHLPCLVEIVGHKHLVRDFLRDLPDLRLVADYDDSSQTHFSRPSNAPITLKLLCCGRPPNRQGISDIFNHCRRVKRVVERAARAILSCTTRTDHSP
jgi:hypothetical protein